METLDDLTFLDATAQAELVRNNEVQPDPAQRGEQSNGKTTECISQGPITDFLNHFLISGDKISFHSRMFNFPGWRSSVATLQNISFKYLL